MEQNTVFFIIDRHNYNKYSIWKCNSRSCKGLRRANMYSSTAATLAVKNVTLFRQYNSRRGREALCISKWKGVESEGHRLDMTDNSEQPTMWRGSQAHISRNTNINITSGPHTSHLTTFILFSTSDWTDGRQIFSHQKDPTWMLDAFVYVSVWCNTILVIFLCKHV